MTTPLQIYIEGNGPVGLACALFLARHWPEPAAISLTPPAPVDPADHGDPSRVAQAALAKRPLALSAGSRQLIERVARFPTQCGAILTVEVALENRAGRVRIPSSDLDQSALGYVLRHGDLVESLEAALAQTGVRRETPVLKDFQGLIIRASGDAGRTPQEAEGRDFEQSALLGEVTLERGSAWATGTALERFTAQGPLAMLPLHEERQFALVWCGPTALTAQRLAAPELQSVKELANALGPSQSVLAVRERMAVPLRRSVRRQRLEMSAAQTQVWIGNAAQSLHPVAGQGLNLGLRDAHFLAQTLVTWRLARPTALLADALQVYAAQRQTDRLTTLWVTDTLATVFCKPVLAPVQSALMTMLDLCSPLRRPLARRFAF